MNESPNTVGDLIRSAIAESEGATLADTQVTLMALAYLLYREKAAPMEALIRAWLSG